MAEEARVDTFANGLLQVLLPVVQETDARVQGLFEAQEALQKEIHRLSKELENFVETAQSPTLSAYAQKLTTSRQRMEHINTVLIQIQERLARLEKNYVKK